MIVDTNKSFAIYSFPKTSKFQFISGELKYENIQKNKKNAFLINFFKDNTNAFFIEKQIYKSFTTKELSKIKIDYKSLKINKINNKEEPTNYINLVKKGIEHIKKNRMRKIVLSSNKIVEIDNQLNIIKILQKIRQTQPNAFINFIYMPNKYCWIGATPELLTSFKEGEVKTVAIAGSEFKNSINQQNFSQKEQEEQKIVQNDVENIFNSLGMQYSKTKPYLLEAGNIKHLKTTFYAKNTNNISWQDFVIKLQPTSAVCGNPKQKALLFIIENEKYEREFFSGYLGVIDHENRKTDLFVNLRCAQLFQNYAKLYAGAGITVHSDPKKEYNEISQKMKTIDTIITNLDL